MSVLIPVSLFDNYCSIDRYIITIDKIIQQFYNNNKNIIFLMVFLFLYLLVLIKIYLLFNFIINYAIKTNEKINNSMELLLQQSKNIEEKNIQLDKKIYDIDIKIEKNDKSIEKIDKKLIILNDEMV